MIQVQSHPYELQSKHYNEAESDFSNAIEIRRNMLGLKHPETVDYYIGLAYAHIGQEKFEEASDDLDKAREICDDLELSSDFSSRIDEAYKLCRSHI